jgi:hypothetical protein
LERIVSGRRPVSVNLAFCVSRLAGVPFDDLLAGRYVPSGVCPFCGRGSDFADEPTVAQRTTIDEKTDG